MPSDARGILWSLCSLPSSAEQTSSQNECDSLEGCWFMAVLMPFVPLFLLPVLSHMISLYLCISPLFWLLVYRRICQPSWGLDELWEGPVIQVFLEWWSVVWRPLSLVKGLSHRLSIQCHAEISLLLWPQNYAYFVVQDHIHPSIRPSVGLSVCHFLMTHSPAVALLLKDLLNDIR